MKKLKTIRLIQKGLSLTNNEMGRILGGYYDYASNSNSASGCNCTGSSQGNPWCNDNNNSAQDCSCSGNDNNKNSQSGCQCGTSSTC